MKLRSMLAGTTAGVPACRPRGRAGPRGIAAATFVKTPEGRMLLHFPTSALPNVKKGDSVTIELALKDNGPAPKTK
jgi:hypothetical protein